MILICMIFYCRFYVFFAATETFISIKEYLNKMGTKKSRPLIDSISNVISFCFSIAYKGNLKVLRPGTDSRQI